MGTTNKVIVLIIFALFLTSLVIMPPTTVKASPKTITVPDDYPTIESAVGNASAGDTVFVKKGEYNLLAHGLLIDKSLSLIGEDNKETILISHNVFSGNNINRGTIDIEASNVVISGFTITNGVWAIHPYYNNFNVKILRNIIII